MDWKLPEGKNDISHTTGSLCWRSLLAGLKCIIDTPWTDKHGLKQSQKNHADLGCRSFLLIYTTSVKEKLQQKQFLEKCQVTKFIFSAHKQLFILAHSGCLLSFLRLSFGWWPFLQVFNLYEDTAQNYFPPWATLSRYTTLNSLWTANLASLMWNDQREERAWSWGRQLQIGKDSIRRRTCWWTPKLWNYVVILGNRENDKTCKTKSYFWGIPQTSFCDNLDQGRKKVEKMLVNYYIL